ncbi:MAG: DUF3634 family protein [bacterium]|nr:DUF3634 family protein [bacterium]
MRSLIHPFLLRFWSSASVVIEILAGRVRVVRGKVRPGLVSDLSDVCRDQGIEGGLIRVFEVSRGQHRFKFTGGIPKAAHQPLRNVCGVYLY